MTLSGLFVVLQNQDGEKQKGKKKTLITLIRRYSPKGIYRCRSDELWSVTPGKT